MSNLTPLSTSVLLGLAWYLLRGIKRFIGIRKRTIAEGEDDDDE
jgi:hypothetical protein